jgi:ATP-dependent helicase/nuclease subunit A
MRTAAAELHPIVAQMEPSPEQIPAIMARGLDVAVTAGAGTGKTRTLVARYLALLAEGRPLRSLLAITFTNKAAREMRNRVRAEMRAYLARPDLLRGEREMWQRLYRELDAARIGTLHAFCTEILRAHPAEAGIDPRFAVLEEGQAAILLGQALEETLAWAADDPTAVALFAVLGERDLANVLNSLLDRRLEAEEAFKNMPADLVGAWHSALAGVRLPPKPRTRKAAAEGLSSQDEVLALLAPALKAAFGWATARYEFLKRERDVLDFDDLEARAIGLLEENESVCARWQAEFSAILVDEYQDTNGRQNHLVRLLNHPAGKLFIVGDAKQSIYAFRGADVSVFRKERARVTTDGGLARDLDTSYRAHQALIEGLNNLLAPVLGSDLDPDRPWHEPFAPLRHDRVEPSPGFMSPHIEMHLTVGTKGSGALDRAAAALAARLEEIVECGDVRVREGRDFRDVNYGDVAILCRTSTSFMTYEDALEAASIPYLTVAGRGFYGRPEIRDLLNALQALSDPTDDLALTGLLRSPAVGLTDASLFQLFAHREDRRPLWTGIRDAAAFLDAEDAQKAGRAVAILAELHSQAGRTAVADLLKKFLDATGYRAALIAAGQGRSARNVAKLLADAQASGIIGVGDFLEYAANLRDSGVREGEARATADQAVQIMSIHAAKGLEFPVVVIGDANSKPPSRTDVLIDKTFGVLLPQRDEAKQRAAVYEAAQGLAKDRLSAESCRLFYVAATRAQEKLILSAAVQLKGDGTPGWLGDWLGKLAAPAALGIGRMAIDHDEEGERVLQISMHAGNTPVACYVYESHYVHQRRVRPPARPATQSTQLPPPLLAPVAALPEMLDEPTAAQERVPAERVWRVVPAVAYPTAPAWVVGSLVHQALAAWRFPEWAAPEAGASSQGAWDIWMEAQARGYGLVDREQLRDAVQTARGLLRRFQASTLYQSMAAATRRLHEVPYSIIGHGGQPESGTIDALILVDGSWQVIEFKTDDIRDAAALERLLVREDYVPQVVRYAAAVEEFLGQRPETLLCLLNYAGGVAVRRVAP